MYSCQNRQTKQASEQSEVNGEFAKLEFQEEFYNFGKLKAGEIATYAFQFKNIGTVPLVISKADTDCGCVQVVFPEKPVAIGASAYLDVTFNSSGEVGKQLKTITIVANTEKPMQFYITADVKNEWINLNN